MQFHIQKRNSVQEAPTISHWRKKISCDKCKKKFSKQSGLTYHMEMVHEGKRNYSCSACERKVSTRQSLKGHEEKCAIKTKQMREQLELKKEI